MCNLRQWKRNEQKKIRESKTIILRAGARPLMLCFAHKIV